jgi:hypothetical protein
VHRHEVRFPEKRAEIDARGPQGRFGRRVRRDGVLVEHSHVEPEGAPGHGPADPPEADDPQRLSVDVPAQQQQVFPLLEPALADVAVALDHPSRRRHHQRPGEVRGGVREHVGGVGDDDPVPGRGRHVDIVEADRDVGDYAQLGAGGQQLVVDEVGDQADQPFAVLEPGHQLGLREGCVPLVQVDLRPLSGGLQGLLGQGSGDQDRGSTPSVSHCRRLR